MWRRREKALENLKDIGIQLLYTYLRVRICDICDIVQPL